MVPPPPFAGDLFRPTRGLGSAWPPRRGCPARDGTDGCSLAPAATRVRKWNSVYRRWARGCDQGVWPRRLAYLQADPDLSAVLLDSTGGRAHVRAAGVPKRKKREPAPDRHRGGFHTQIPILVDRRAVPCA